MGRIFIKGNEAIAESAVRGGCRLDELTAAIVKKLGKKPQFLEMNKAAVREGMNLDL